MSVSKPSIQPDETSLFQARPEGPGARIGPYKLLQEIGEGGFGVVYMAEQQEPVRRQVALKIIKPGMDTKEVIARFESERQALALMDHPNIARVLDAGATESGRPYFVMELVKGVPITEYCDKNNLATTERLELFATVCRAVQHAHQKGVIHRDIKPSNVMVTLHDGQPVPKVIDFGVAKATTQRLTERTMFTAYGQMIGTPAYMSPEQAEMSGLDIDTRSDIYSLGVLLYELLTGTTPFEMKRLRDASYIEMQRIIREEEPPKPSTRISTLGDNLTVIASHRRTDPAKLRQLLSGDLDLIVMKALEKERGRRYETPNSFAQDIERYLRHEAIHARPPSAVYRLRKFSERNRAAVAAAAAIAACLIFGTVVSSLLAIHALRERDAAQAARLEAEQQRDTAQKAKQAEEDQRKLADERLRETETARQAEAEQRLLAEQRRSEAEMAQQNEAELRAMAEEKRRAMERQANEIASLNSQLGRTMDEQRRTLYTAHMNLAQKAWDSDNVAHLLEILDSHRPKPGESDLRGFEWHYWNRLCHSDLRTLKLPLSFEAGVGVAIAGRTVEFSPDGTRIAGLFRSTPSPQSDLLKVWDLETGSELLSLKLPAPVAGAERTSPAYGRWLLFQGNQRVAVVHPILGAGTTAPERSQLALYDIASGKSVLTLDEQSPNGYAASADGSRLAALVNGAADADGKPVQSAKLWDSKSGELVATVPLSGGPWSKVALNASGTQFAATTFGMIVNPAAVPREFTIRIWDVASGKEQTTIPLTMATAVEFSPDGKQLALVGGAADPKAGSDASSTIKGGVYNAATGDRLWSLELENPISGVYARPVFSRDGQCVAFVRPAFMLHDRSLKLYSAATGTPLQPLKGHTHPINGVAFLADARRVRTVASDGTVKTWEVPQLRAASPESFGIDPSVFTVLSPDGTRLAAMSNRSASNPAIALRDVSASAILWRVSVPGSIEQFAFSTDNRYVAASWSDSKAAPPATGQIQIWEATSGKLVRSFPKATPPRTISFAPGADSIARPGPDFAFAPGGHEIAVSVAASAGDDARWRAQVFNVSDGREISISEPLTGQPHQLQFSPDGRWLICQTAIKQPTNSKTATSRVEMRVLDTATGRAVWGQPLVPQPLVFSGDASRLVGYVVNQVILWNAATGEELSRIPNVPQLQKLAVSPSGKRLAIVTLSSTQAGLNPFDRSGASLVRVWDADRGTELFKLQGHAVAVQDIVFSPDGARIATTAGTTADTRLWDAMTGQELLALPGANRDLQFTSDRRLTATVFATPFGEALANLGPSRQIVIADASSLTPETEAQKLVEILTRRGEGQSLLTRREIRETIESDGSLDAATRARALELVHGFRREFPLLNNAAWTLAMPKDQPRRQYERAVELAIEASELEPTSPVILNTRGVANYRAGHFAQAKGDLNRSIEISAAARRPPAPEDLVFLAMVERQLGNSSAAADLFARFQKAIVRSGSTKLGEWREYLTEAEELFGIQKSLVPAAPQEIAGWGQTVDPAGDCQFVAAADSLTIHVPGTLHSLAPANRNFDAPRVLQEVEGDFTAEVKVTCPIDPQTPLTDRTIAFFGAGFLVWESADHFLRVERSGYYLHPNFPAGTTPPEPSPPEPTPPRKHSSHAPLVEYIQGGRDVTVGRSPFNAATPLLPGPATWLRLVRRGQSMAIFLSHDGQTWTEAPRVDAKFPTKVNLGVIARNNSGGAFEATFSEWKLTTP